MAIHKLPNAATLAELVRLPSVLTVPGDALVGAAATDGVRAAPRLAAASCLLYMAGMALNDYADRETDAVERPERPIPSGRIEPVVAFRVGVAATAAGVGVGALGGRRSLSVVIPLAATVWSYDLALKSTPLGPLTMALARSLDVLLGASPRDVRSAVPAAGVVGAHTVLVSIVSRSEVHGGTRALARGALAGTAAVTAAAVTLVARARRPSRRGSATRVAAGVALAAALAIAVGRAELAAARQPTATNMRRVVGTGVLGLMPLEASLLAATGPAWAAAGIVAAWPVARRLAQRTSVT